MTTTSDRKRPTAKATLAPCAEFQFRFRVPGMPSVTASLKVWDVAAWDQIPVERRPANAMVSDDLRSVAVIQADVDETIEARIEMAREAEEAADPRGYHAKLITDGQAAVAGYNNRVATGRKLLAERERDHG